MGITMILTRRSHTSIMTVLILQRESTHLERRPRSWNCVILFRYVSGVSSNWMLGRSKPKHFIYAIGWWLDVIHWCQDKWLPFSDDISTLMFFSCRLLHLMTISLKYFPRRPINNVPAFITQIAPLSVQTSISHKPRHVGCGKLHDSVVTEWSPAYLHK